MPEATWAAYKSAKEQWIAHQSGGPVWQINAVCGVALASLALCILIDRQPHKWRTSVHGVVLLLPLLGACTVLAGHLAELYVLLASLIGVYYVAAPAAEKTERQGVHGSHARTAPAQTSPTPVGLEDAYATDAFTEEPAGVDEPPLVAGPARAPAALGFLTAYRAYMMVMTVICILAVDFRVFPRAFAKCETWGTSLMDLGVGSFVVSHGTVSIGQRHWSKTARRMLPLIVLGAVRVALVKGTEYPEHVSEYGVHWNFFITLGALLPAMDVAQRVLPRTALTPAALLSSAAFEAVLRSTPLQQWAISDKRGGSLISLNKEGIVSLPGYLALGLLGLDIGHVIRAPSRRRGLLRRVFGYWGAYVILQEFLAPSRRLANLPYVVWTAAFNAAFVLLFCVVVEELDADVPPLLARINQRSLAVFLGVRTC